MMTKVFIFFFFIFSTSGLYAQAEESFSKKDSSAEEFLEEENEFSEELSSEFTEEDSDFDPLSEEENFTESDEEILSEEVPLDETPTANRRMSPKKGILSAKGSSNDRYIYHPNQKKGLYKINRENRYYYKFKKSKSYGFFSFKGGNIGFENFLNSNAADQDSSFLQLYDSSSLTTFFLEYNFKPFSSFKLLDLSIEGGFSLANGRGRFTSTGAEAKEKYSFLFFPLNLGLTYKFKFIEDQLLLPYITGAVSYNFVVEYRDNFEKVKYAGIFGASLSGGLGINLGWFERAAALDLDRDFGVNNTYLTLEFRQMISFEEDFNLNNSLFLAGLTFEY